MSTLDRLFQNAADAAIAPGSERLRPSRRVATPFLAGALLLGLAACGGDAESAADMDSMPWEDEVPEVQHDETASPDAPPVTTQPGTAPAPATPPSGATRPQTPPSAPPASGVQPPPPAPEVAPEPEVVPEPVGATLPAGTQLSATLENSLSTRTSRAGDTFTARIGEALRAADGTEVLPAGSRLEGRVVESRESPSAEEQAILVLEIRALLLNGSRFPIQATVLETQLATEARDSAQRQAATVATGAAAGAVIGRVLGRDTRSTVAGAAAGAAAGAGIALTSRDGHASMGEGAVIRIRLDTPVVVAN